MHCPGAGRPYASAGRGFEKPINGSALALFTGYLGPMADDGTKFRNRVTPRRIRRLGDRPRELTANRFR